jgi:hypothetical protein
VVGEGEWAAAKHGGRGARGWKKLHLGVDRSGVIIAHALTESTADDATVGIVLIGAAAGDIASVTADEPTTRSPSMRPRTRDTALVHGSAEPPPVDRWREALACRPLHAS